MRYAYIYIKINSMKITKKVFLTFYNYLYGYDIMTNNYVVIMVINGFI